MMIQNRRFTLFVFILLTCIYHPYLAFTAEQPAAGEISVSDIAPDQVDSTLAKLSDEQVRSLLVAELSKGKEVGASAESQKASSLVYKARGWLHLLDSDKSSRSEEADETQSALASIAQDLITIPKKIGGGSVGGFFFAVIMLTVVFGAAYLVEKFFRRFTDNFSKQFQENAIPDLDGPMRLLAGIMRSIPVFIHIAVYSVAAIVFFFLLPFDNDSPVQYLFLALLFILAFYRTINQLSLIICAPTTSSLRVLQMDDDTAAALHKGILYLCT